MQLRAHVETDHIRNSLHKCYVCDLTFLSHRLLQEHISTSHCKKKIHCLYCDFVSDNMINLNTHTKNEHTVQVKISNKVPDDIPVFNWYDDFICQLDGGGDDLPVTFDSPSYNLFPAASSAPSGSKNLRKASYTLDRKKQITKLKNDTLLSDFEIVVSPTETNINILCSTGFYSLVVLPAFSLFSVGYTLQAAGVYIYCYDIIGSIDGTDAGINTVLHFRLTAADKSNVGSVAIHLHHTVRKVQVQGSAMINQSRAGVWFVENILMKTFTNSSNDKSLDISNFNKAVNEMVVKHIEKNSRQDKCKVCSVIFIGRTICEDCNQCNHTYHKKCYLSNDHPCMSSASVSGSAVSFLSLTSSSSPSASTASLTNVSTSAVPLSQGSFPSFSHPSNSFSSGASVLSSPSLTESTAGPSAGSLSTWSASGVPLMVSTLPPITQLPFISQSTAGSTNTVPPGPAPGHFLSVSSAAGSNSHESRIKVNQNKPKTKQTLASTKETIDLEFARIQISTIQAKLVSQDVTIKDLRLQNSILLDRLSIFEKAEKQATYDQYFSKQSGSQASATGLHQEQPTTTCACHCYQPRQCCTTHSCYRQPASLVSSPENEALDNLSKNIDELKKDVLYLKSKLISPFPDSNNETSSASSPRKQECFPSSHNVMNTSLPSNNAVCAEDSTDAHADASIITIDEYMPNISSEENLNCQDPTIQF